MSRLRVILFGLLYLAAMLACGTLLATLIAQLQSHQVPVPTPALAPPTRAASVTLPPTDVRPTVTLRATVTLYPTSTPEAASAGCDAPAGFRGHYVQPGDTLFSLALHYGVTVRAIQRANRWRWPSYIIAETCLRIPQ